MKIAVIRNDDARYLAWLAEHPRAYVVNAWAPPTSGVPVLHRATCRTINGTPTAGRTWTASTYLKIVSDEPRALVEWVRREARRELRRCLTCHP